MKQLQPAKPFAIALAALLTMMSTAHAVVGYVNMNYANGFSLIANPLDSGNNTLGNLFGSTLPDGSTISKWNGSSLVAYQFEQAGIDGTGWYDTSDNLANGVLLGVGEGAVLHTPSTPPTITYVGGVVGYNVSTDTRIPVTPPPPGIYLRGTIAPLNGSTFQDLIGRAPVNTDAVLNVDPAGYFHMYLFTGGVWHDPSGGSSAPLFDIGRSAFFDLTGNEFAGFPPSLVPEPASFTLLAAGGIAFMIRRRR